MSRPRDRWLLESPERQQQVTTSSHPSTPDQTQRVPKGPASLPFPEPRNPVNLSQINLNILSTGASRGIAAFENTVRY